MLTQSIWTESIDPPVLHPLRHDIVTDVAVVGAGITGMLTAALLSQAGRRVVVLEAGRFGHHGTTHRTSAHLTSVLDHPFRKLIQTFGKEAITEVVQGTVAAVERIEAMAAQYHIDCDFARVPGFRVAEEERQAAELDADAEAAREVGLAVSPAGLVPLPFPVARAYQFDGQALFHPMKFINGLADRLHGEARVIFDRTRVEKAHDGEPCSLETTRGTVICTDVVLATHSPIGLWPTIQARLVPNRSYCMAMEIDGPLPRGLFWDCAEPYHYIRPGPRPDGPYLIVGGCDHHTGDHSDTVEQFEALAAYAAGRFTVRPTHCRWSAELFEPADGLPFIGLAPGSEHVHIATGFSGTGLTFGCVAARLIADRILGIANPLAPRFAIARLHPMAAAKRAAESLGMTMRGLVGERWQGRRSELPTLSPGQGEVVSINGRRLAVSRDREGVSHAVSAVCPHMGCIVAWNAAEACWDCPCHGSQFAPSGEPLAGPATTGLRPEGVEAPIIQQQSAT